MAIAPPQARAEIVFETPEPGAWEAYQQLASRVRAGVQLDPNEDLPGRQVSYKTIA